MWYMREETFIRYKCIIIIENQQKKEDTVMTENNKKRGSIEVEPDFHRELKLFATLRGMTLQNYITTLIKNDMKNMK